MAARHRRVRSATYTIKEQLCFRRKIHKRHPKQIDRSCAAAHRKRLAAGNARVDANVGLAELQDERPFVSQLMLVRRFDEHARPAHVYHVGKRARQFGVASDGNAIGSGRGNYH